MRHSEAGAEDYVESGMPTSLRHAMRAHDGGCSTLKFEHGGGSLISGGHDRLVRTWDTERGVPLATLRGCLGSVLDLALSHDDTMVLAASADHKLYLWEVQSGRIRHTLTGDFQTIISSWLCFIITCSSIIFRTSLVESVLLTLDDSCRPCRKSMCSGLQQSK